MLNLPWWAVALGLGAAYYFFVFLPGKNRRQRPTGQIFTVPPAQVAPPAQQPAGNDPGWEFGTALVGGLTQLGLGIADAFGGADDPDQTPAAVADRAPGSSGISAQLDSYSGSAGGGVVVTNPFSF